MLNFLTGSITIKAQSDLIQQSFFSIQILDLIPIHIIITNKHRQIVFANKEFRDTFCNDSSNDYIGMRPGESIECRNADMNPDGCGASQKCRFCGATNAILESQQKGYSIREGIFTINKNSALNVLITATQVNVGNEEFTLVAFRDISNEKRRKALERIFFHDVLNMAGGLKGFLEMLKDDAQSEFRDIVNIAANISNKLIDEIQSQRTLISAENGDLHLNITAFSTRELLEEVKLLLTGLDATSDKEIRINNDAYDGIIHTDKALLRRVIINLGKNALEAINPGASVLLDCSCIEDSVKSFEFSVQNPGQMPTDIQYQLFQRSFSTKSNDRGIGTYSIKLLTENYLGGTIRFTSDEKSGTKFMVRYPARLK